ncbi:MAG: FtsK/SpoIIIE domain-containing protein [Eubacteriales bacterium]|nr:FtsK/SpoIIIE domain-containing protein [Eubacteriales bacterium]
MTESTTVFEKMPKVSKLLSEEILRYTTERQKADDDFHKEEERIRKEYEAAEAASAGARDRKTAEADARLELWKKRKEQCLEASAISHNRAVDVLAQATGRKAGSVDTDQAKDILCEETKQRIALHRKDDNSTVIELCKREVDLAKKIREVSANLQNAAESRRNREVLDAEAQYSEELEAHRQRRDASLKANARRHKIRRERVEETFFARVENAALPDKLREECEEIKDRLPDYEGFEPVETSGDGIQFGHTGYDITEHLKDDPIGLFLSRRFEYAIREIRGRKYLLLPYGHGFDSAGFSTMIEFRNNNREEVADLLRNLAFSLFMSIHVNKCWCTFIDPVSLGKTFAIFSPMAEKNESGKGDERVIDTQVWSDEEEIEERLKLVVDHTKDVQRRCLQGKYRNILDYNKDADVNAEPLRFLIIMDFPRGFSKKALEYLDSIVDTGPDTGVYTIIGGDLFAMETSDESRAVESIRSRIRSTITTEKGVLYAQERTLDGKLRFFPCAGPTIKQCSEIVSRIRKHLGEKITIKYKKITKEDPDQEEYWFHKSAKKGISVPIGLEGAGKTVNLEFGKAYSTYHAMVGGTTGFGKSTLFHTIIQGIIFNYKPEDVKLYLLDFKEGVEFKKYVKYRLPNIRVISVKTEKEFGLAVLDEIDDEITRRSRLFKEAGVAHIEDYWTYRGQRGEGHEEMPRLLLIIDEVQELMNDGDSTLVRNCAERIQRIVKEGGNAFGIHLIIATQTFEDVKGIDSGVYANMYTRISFNSSRETGELLLGKDNKSLQQLSALEEGQVIFNNKAGDDTANRTIRIAQITDTERDAWMRKIRELQMDRFGDDLQKPRLMISGPGDDAEHCLSVFAREGKRPPFGADPAYHLYVGESLTMVNTYLPFLRNENGKNFLIAGRDSRKTRLSRIITSYCVLSLLYETIRIRGEISLPFITVVDFGGRSVYGTGEADMLETIEATVPEAFHAIKPQDISDGIEMLYDELFHQDYAGRQQFVIIYGLNRAKKLTGGTGDRTAKEHLVELFSRGPEMGMNFIVWANDPEAFIDTYKPALDSFDLRLAYGLTEKEYLQLTDEKTPEEMGEWNAVSYDQIDDNQRVRIYEQPTQDWLKQFLKNIRRFIRIR